MWNKKIVAVLSVLCCVLILSGLSITLASPQFDADIPIMPTSTGGQLSAPTAIPDEVWALAWTGVSRNADWTPFEMEFEGVPMVLVPAGCFMMGENGEGGEQCFDEPFWIDRYEVTNAQYAEFVEAGGYEKSEFWTEAGWAWREEENITSPQYWSYDNRFSTSNQPVVAVSWYEALAYANWRGCQLPSEAQWEYAARGPDALLYPWGDDFVADNVVYAENDEGKPSEVGSRLGGASWVGALDLSGNVWEWVSSRAVGYPYPYTAGDGREDLNGASVRILRGGSWAYNQNDARAVYRLARSPDYLDNDSGFRVVCGFRPS